MHVSKNITLLILSMSPLAGQAAAHDGPVTPGVLVGENTQIASTARISGDSVIGNNSTIGHYSILENVRIGESVKILPHCVLTNVVIEDKAIVGPFAHLHDGTVVEEEAVVGNFVEGTRSRFGKRSKVKHLSYVGDAELGEKVNVGGGTITCNFDGANKNKTVIEDGALIGSNNCLVAPITVGAGAVTGAGSTLTEDVPADALAIARSRQTNKPGFASKLLQKFRAKKIAHELERE